MPVGNTTTTLGVEVHQTVFKSFESSMSDEEDHDDWEPGAFPTTSKGGDHVFSDEPFSDPNYYSLEMVKEGSKEETLTGAPSLRQDELMSISMASSDTPAINNRAEVVQQKKLLEQQPQQQEQQQVQHVFPVGVHQTTSSGISGGTSSSGFYPYNIYQSLSSKQTLGAKPGADWKDPNDTTGIKNERQRKNPPSSSTSSSKPNQRSNKKSDREDPSSMDPPPVTPMSLEEEASSVYTDQQSHMTDGAASAVQTPRSVFSTRSRRQQQGKRYMIRHTLSTNQQVTANPANMLKNLFIGIEQERHMHKLAALHFRATHSWLMFLPAIILAMVSGLVALIFEADLNANDDLRVYSSIFVGITALISVVWQAVSKQLDLGTRGALHDATSDAMKRLSEDILLTLSSTDTIPAEYVALIGEKFDQALDVCPSSIPFQLESAFSAVSDRMMLMLQPPMGQPPRKQVQKLDYMHLYTTAYNELTSEIIHHWAWPFGFPQSRGASEAALRNFKAIITEGREVSKRKGCIMRLCCPCLSVPTIERSLFEVVPEASVTGGGEGYMFHRNIVQQQQQQHYQQQPQQQHYEMGSC